MFKHRMGPALALVFIEALKHAKASGNSQAVITVNRDHIFYEDSPWLRKNITRFGGVIHGVVHANENIDLEIK